jgi:hypothetical protein
MTDLIDNVFDRFKFIPVVDLDKVPACTRQIEIRVARYVFRADT